MTRTRLITGLFLVGVFATSTNAQEYWDDITGELPGHHTEVRVYVNENPDVIGGPAHRVRINLKRLIGARPRLREVIEKPDKGMVFGNDRFKEELAALTGRRLKPKKRGRPTGWRKEKN